MQIGSKIDIPSPQNMEQNPFKNNNLNEDHVNDESKDDIPRSSNSSESSSSNESEETLDQQLIDLISHGQFKSSHAIELMTKWRDSKMTEAYSSKSKISDEEVFHLYLIERDNLLNKAKANLTNEDEEKLVNFINQNNLL